jgi:hypothetical protein
MTSNRAVKAPDEFAALGVDHPPLRQNPAKYDGDGRVADWVFPSCWGSWRRRRDLGAFAYS